MCFIVCGEISPVGYPSVKAALNRTLSDLMAKGFSHCAASRLTCLKLQAILNHVSDSSSLEQCAYKSELLSFAHDIVPIENAKFMMNACSLAVLVYSTEDFASFNEFRILHDYTKSLKIKTIDIKA